MGVVIMRFARIITTFIVMAFAVTALTVTVYAAPTLEGFMGIAWGANVEQVKQGMAQNGFYLHNEEKWGVLTQEVFDNGSYAGYMVYATSAFLKYNTMYGAVVSIKGEAGSGIDAIYSHLKTLLQEKYGMPEGETQSWANNKPSAGVKVTSTTWIIPNEGGKPHEIVLSKTPGLVPW